VHSYENEATDRWQIGRHAAQMLLLNADHVDWQGGARDVGDMAAID